MTAEPPSPPVEPPGRPTVTVWSLMLGTGPRFARDAFGPVLVFYLGWRLSGIAAGVAAATAVSVLAYGWERRRARSGLAAGIGLGIALVQALAGLASRSPIGYFAPGIIAQTIYGLVFVGSVMVGRPLAGVLARETYPFPPEVRASALFRRTFSRVSLAWGAYLLLRSATRGLVLTKGTVEAYVVINLVTGIPLTAALMSWSLWYGVRSFRRATTWD